MSTPAPAPSDIAAATEIAREALRAGANMMDALTRRTDLPRAACIEIAYALQSGAYTGARNAPAAAAYRAELQDELAGLLAEHECRSVLDLGAGEGTAWIGWPGALDHLCLLDLSLNRLSWARANLAGAPARDLSLVKGDIAHPPCPPLGFDAVTTMHALEPNGPSAHALVEAAASCAARLLVLLEPDYETASDTMRARMERHGYACDIFKAAQALPDFEIVTRRPLRRPVNPDNATSLIALERKQPPARPAPGRLADPVTRNAMTSTAGGFEDASGTFVYPQINQIACLAPSAGGLLGRI